MDNELLLIVCGAPLAARAVDLSRALTAAGWQVAVVASAAATAWLDGPGIEQVTGAAPRDSFRTPAGPRLRHPSAVVACPITFNSLNKAAAGIADTYAAAALSEAIGARLPAVVVPMINERLWGHPACGRSLDVLRDAGVAFMDPRTGAGAVAPVPSGTGEDVTAVFDPAWIVERLPRPA